MEIARVAEGFGQPLMPWQRLVADVGGELLEDGSPAYREVIVTVPRQSGKTTLVLAWELHRALMWGSPQRVAYTAQSGNAAREKLIDDQYEQLIKNTPMRASIKQVKKAMGSTALIFKNGSRIDALPTSADAGHGKTLDLAVIDEAMADVDNMREQGLRPAMATRSDAQLLIPSTAGTQRSSFLLRKVEAGRSAVDSDARSGIAYFEWSAPMGADIDDRSAWWSCMPALGNTISEETVEADKMGMPESEFRRAYFNQWTSSVDRVIPDAPWQSVVSADARPSGRIVFGVDAHPELDQGWVVAASDNAAELITPPDIGTGWMVDYLVERHHRFNAPIAVDVSGPLSWVADDLKSRGVAVIEYRVAELARACAWWWEAMSDQKFRVRQSERLDDAVAAVGRRFSGDKWVWVRSREFDTSPVLAMTLALHAASQKRDPLSNIW